MEPEPLFAEPIGIQSYSPDEWDRQRPDIEKWYQVQRKSTADVKRALHQRGFRVNERMLKTRVKKWGLDKKHKKSDMRTAVALFARDRSRWSAQHPTFRIRNRTVTYAEILAYFRRQRITDPVAWVNEQQGDGFVASPDVELIIPDVHEGNNNTSARPPSGQTSDQAAGQSTGSQWKSAGENRERSSSELINSPKKTFQTSIGGESIIYPYQHRPGDQIIWAMRAYVASYLESPRASTHREPQVHRFTTHAYFAQRMQKGMFSYAKGETLVARDSFEGAFNLTKEIFRNDHPMSIAMLMSVICELKKNNLENIIIQLASYVRQMVAMQNKSHVLSSLFEVMEHSGTDAANLAICSMRMALGYLAGRGESLNWKTLYLKERLADCLYYMGMSGEGGALRSSLLEEQELKYGKYARNVLWSLTNVADDHLQRGEPMKADLKFRDALERSDTLEGYERANSRYKALEGLAKTHLLAANSIFPEDTSLQSGVSFEELKQQQQKILVETYRLYQEAEEEAATWFEPDSLRRIRVVENKNKLLARIDTTNLPSVIIDADEARRNSSPKIDLRPWQQPS